MLPLHQAIELRVALIEYLKATFSFRERTMHKAFYEFIEHPETGLFKGPYLQVALPFKTRHSDTPIPLEIAPDFEPHLHQIEAFHRLTSRDHTPKPTLLTTGTGSGKTESFLYPILDYCAQNRRRDGIKAIILYPMNALASDQAMRLAKIIHEDSRLNGITAGLFIGEGQDPSKYPRSMGPKNIIEHRESILASPPDILFTNFKMLDYALMQSRFHSLWKQNLTDTTLLQYLVLDELHTYDGAQGTDVANLIRRFKLKLNVPDGQLCPVGTSATIGKGDDAAPLLATYASTIFGEEITKDAVITEKRVDWKEFLGPNAGEDLFIPRIGGLVNSRLGAEEDYDSFIRKQIQVWQLPENITRFELGQELKKLRIVADVLEVLGSGICDFNQLIESVSDRNPGLRELPERDASSVIEPRKIAMESIVALLSEARADALGLYPFVNIRVQLWVRELSSLLRVVDEKPAFVWRDQATGVDKKEAALPMYFCRECGASGWLARKQDNRNRFDFDISNVVRDFISRHKNIYLVNTDASEHLPVDEYKVTVPLRSHLHKESLELLDRILPDKSIPIVALRQDDTNRSHEHICPECGTINALATVGTRTATLLSVAVGQSLSSDLDLKLENDRKVLAFTNSVQDAAHMAGFVQARNARFGFRTSVQRVMNHVNKELTLPEFHNAFLEYWKEYASGTGEAQEEAFFHRFFPEDLEKKTALEQFKSRNGDFDPRFVKEFDLRLFWDLLSEFGFNSQIGRTLEKTGSSGVQVDDSKIIELWQRLNAWMRMNLMDTVQESDFLSFTAGILYRLRTRGAFDHPYLSKFRDVGLRLWDLNWNSDSTYRLHRRFGERSRFPRMIGTHPHHRNLLDSTFTMSSNWFHRYALKSFPLVPGNKDVLNEFFQEFFKAGTEVGLFNQQQAAGEINYGLEPSAWRISKEIHFLECDVCGHHIGASRSDSFLPGSSCQQYRCSGHMNQAVSAPLSYYQRVYNRRRAPRVVADEHTGILQRSDRERLESQFKSTTDMKRRNVLVATSTLEMGIDIGNLDIAMNIGVPPLPSNFVQRVGRAGRKSGNALVSNFVQTKAHDLYFYEQPLEMMDGVIHTPGCFLNSAEILRRQYLAYCFDSWSSANPDSSTVTPKLKFLRLLSVTEYDPTLFFNQMLSWVSLNLDELRERFRSKYEADLEAERLNELEKWSASEHFAEWVRAPFGRLRRQLLDLKSKKRALDQEIKRRKLDSNDPEAIQMSIEIGALNRYQQGLLKKRTLEFMTNAGLLPNYAFPETGVQLLGHIYQPPPPGSLGKEKGREEVYEYVRAGSSALRELAPHAHFYAQKYAFHINGLQVHEWSSAEHSTLQIGRFCSNCDQLTLDPADDTNECPKCGHPSFAASSNKHAIAVFTGARAQDRRDAAYLDDAYDERQTERYRISRHLDFSKSSGGTSLALVDIPFGIEFAGRVELTELNLGLQSSLSTNTVQIDQHSEVPKHGFITCKNCGYSTNTPELEVFVAPNGKKNNATPFHYPFCKSKDALYDGKADGVFEEVFLLHKKSTEVLKILLPAQEFAIEENVELFKAGLNLGLQRYYKGNPDHIAFISYRELNKTTGRFDQYLVLHDKVPGGTGYLKKLFSKEVFTEILHLAHQALAACECQHKGKDGCYHCVRSYGNQSKSELLSRSRAESVFERLSSIASQWQELGHSLSDVSKTGKIEESELEERFIRIVADLAKARGWSWSERLFEGVRNYFVGIPQKPRGDVVLYWIRPQVDLGPHEQMPYATTTDFLFVPVQPGSEDQPVRLEKYRKIAVYLDGFTYHAKDGEIFAADIRKRVGILQNEDYRVWVLTWFDLNRFEAKDPVSRRDRFALKRPEFTETLATMERIPAWHEAETSGFSWENAFERFTASLQIPDNAEQMVMAMVAISANTSFKASLFDESELPKMLNLSNSIPDILRATKQPFWSKSSYCCRSSLFDARFFVNLSTWTVRSAISVDEKSIIGIEKDEWELFWHVFGMAQYDRSLAVNMSTNESPTTSAFLDELLESVDAILHPIIRRAKQASMRIPDELTFHIELEGGRFVEAQFCLLDLNIVFLPSSDDDAKIFEAKGYEVADPTTFDLERLK